MQGKVYAFCNRKLLVSGINNNDNNHIRGKLKVDFQLVNMQRGVYTGGGAMSNRQYCLLICTITSLFILFLIVMIIEVSVPKKRSKVHFNDFNPIVTPENITHLNIE